MKKGINIVNLKNQKRVLYQRTTFYSICKMSSCRKPNYKISFLKS